MNELQNHPADSSSALGTSLPREKKPRRWPWIVIIVVLLVFGAGGWVTYLINVPMQTANQGTTDIHTGAEKNTETAAPESETEPETTQDPEEARKEYIRSCTDCDGEDVMRWPEQYIGKYIRIYGEVLQVIEENDPSTGTLVTIRLKSDYDDNTWLLFYNKKNVVTPNGNVLEGDDLVAYGTCTGTMTYKSVLGKQITVPSILVRYIQ